MRNIYIVKNQLFKTGMEALSGNLHFISNLGALDLHNEENGGMQIWENIIGNIGASMLAENIREIPKLIYVNLSY